MTLTSLATSSSFSVTDLMSNTTAIPAVLCTDWINSSTGKRETQKIRWGKDGDIEKSNTKPGELQWQPPAWYCSELERIFRAKSYNAEKRRTLHVKTKGFFKRKNQRENAMVPDCTLSMNKRSPEVIFSTVPAHRLWGCVCSSSSGHSVPAGEGIQILSSSDRHPGASGSSAVPA